MAWGYNTYGQTNVPAPNTGFVAVAAGGNHSLGLKADGSIVAWGWNYYGQTNVPAPNTGFVAVAGGVGTVWVSRPTGPSWRGDTTATVKPTSPPNTGFVAVAAGGDHSLGLKADGSIVAWGYNGYGQTNVPAANTGFVAVAAGGDHSLGLKADGSIVAWGYNGDGQTNVPAPTRVSWPSPRAVATVWVSRPTGPSWRGDATTRVKPTSPRPIPIFVAVAAGGQHSLGLKTDGSIVAWGWNYYGQTNVPAQQRF